VAVVLPPLRGWLGNQGPDPPGAYAPG